MVVNKVAEPQKPEQGRDERGDLEACDDQEGAAHKGRQDEVRGDAPHVSASMRYN